MKIMPQDNMLYETWATLHCPRTYTWTAKFYFSLARFIFVRVQFFYINKHNGNKLFIGIASQESVIGARNLMESSESIIVMQYLSGIKKVNEKYNGIGASLETAPSPSRIIRTRIFADFTELPAVINGRNKYSIDLHLSPNLSTKVSEYLTGCFRLRDKRWDLLLRHCITCVCWTLFFRNTGMIAFLCDTMQFQSPMQARVDSRPITIQTLIISTNTCYSFICY